MRAGHLAAAALLAALLPACATRAVREVPASAIASAADIAAQDARERRLDAITEWDFNGRFAISNGGDGGSGRIDWRQARGDGAMAVSTVTLFAPVTRRSWRLTVHEGDSATLEGLDGGPRSGADAVALLREATGWDIPVPALAYWVRGLRVPGMAIDGQAFDGQSRLLRLRQDGWTIDYQWAEPVAGDPPMPYRIDAMRGPAKVKLVFDQWH